MPDDPELDAIEAALAAVGAALERLADGTYGSCEICGRPVGDRVLADDPVASRCPDHLPLPPMPATGAAGGTGPVPQPAAGSPGA